MANSYTMYSPEIKGIVSRLRIKAGISEDIPTGEQLKDTVAKLERRIKQLVNAEVKREAVYERESARLEATLRMLATVTPSSLRKAVALILYWDKFSWIQCNIIDRMSKADERKRVFFDLPRKFGNVAAMDAWVNRKEFADELSKFGYTDEKAIERTRDRYAKRKPRKSSKKEVK